MRILHDGLDAPPPLFALSLGFPAPQVLLASFRGISESLATCLASLLPSSDFEVSLLPVCCALACSCCPPRLTIPYTFIIHPALLCPSVEDAPNCSPFVGLLPLYGISRKRYAARLRITSMITIFVTIVHLYASIRPIPLRLS